MPEITIDIVKTLLHKGVIPDVDTPTYAQLRDRTTKEGYYWYSDDMLKTLSEKLNEMNSRSFNKMKVALRYIEDQAYGRLARLYAKLKRK